ncbi:MAG: hypothetical protein ABSB88_22760 [Bryobacteraceae bacterium]|jgi:streptogramin lyase
MLRIRLSAAGLLLAVAVVLPAQITFTEYPIPSPASFPDAITTGPDGNLWFVELHNPSNLGDRGDKIARITPAGVVTEFLTPSRDVGEGTATGSDGNIWFTEYFSGRIGRITPTGVISEFPNGGYPFGITAGPDGNLWFAERFGNNIGRITTGGVITEFPIPTAGSQSYYITAGPDGNLWFTEGTANKIGRITTLGVITEFAILTPGNPYGITVGPDGNLWFAEEPANKIGRISTAGVITEFPVPTANSMPYEITAGPDGNLWFTEFNGGKIGRITPAGVITEFPFLAGSGVPIGITTGPDGNLWITGLATIVKATLPAPPPSGITVYPTIGGNTGNVTVQILGNGFQNGLTAKLTGSGADIVGSNTAFSSAFAFILTTTFDLTGATPGVRNVVVTNPDGTSATLTGGFTVQQGGAPQISVNIIGRDKIRFGTAQTYYIAVGNSGNVDAAPGLVSLSVPSTVQYAQVSGADLFVAGSTPDPEFGIPSTAPASGNQNLLFASPGVSAGQTQCAPVGLTLPSSAPVSNFTLTAGWQQDLTSLTLDQFLGLEGIPFIPFPPSGCPACLSQYNAELLANSNVVDAYLAYENAKSTADLGFVQTAAAIGTTIAEAYLVESLGLPTLGAVGVGALITVADTCVSNLFDDQSCLPNLEQTVKLAETGARDCLAGSPNCFGGKPLPQNLVDDLGALIKYFDAAITAMDGFGSEEEEIGAEKAAYGALQLSLGPYRLARAAYQACLSPTTCGGPPPPSPPISPPGTISLPVTGVQSLDPNVKIGPTGVGSSHYISGLAQLEYAIYFDNQPTATAPAQAVTVKDTLDPNLNPSALTLGPITFPNQVVSPPSIPLSVSPFTTTVDLRPTTNLLVQVTTSLNTSTATLTETFQSLDPTTNQPPTDPTAGFLPPGAEGSVFFTVLPKTTVTTGTVIQNTATVVFDLNAPINTPTWSNTIDNTPPVSHVSALPAQSGSIFAVQWSGTDVGSGLGNFTIYVSDNGSSFAPWLNQTTATSSGYNGQIGHSYRFYSIAQDLVGNMEPAKASAETTTQVTQASPVPSGEILVTASGLAYSRVTQTFNGTVTIQNIGSSAIYGPFEVVFTALTGGVTLATATRSYNGSAYLSVPGVTSLTPGQSATVNVQFRNPSNAKISFTPVVYSGSFN